MIPVKKILPVVVLLALFWACEKEIVDPTENPFQIIEKPIEGIDSLKPNSIQVLHNSIFSVKCANPTCHDGTFEPDFRTVESTYNTLVYHPVIKNNAQNSFKYRVDPGHLEKSWLFERLVTGDPNLGRMPLYSPALSYEELQQISGWIIDGAKDAKGNPAVYPNTLPKVNYFVAYDGNSIRIDTNRQNGWASPFNAPNAAFTIIVSVVDDSTASANLQINQLQISLLRDDFTNAQTYQAAHLSGLNWVVSINGASLPKNVQWYFRYYVSDPDHTDETEFPRDDSYYWYKENASFIVN